MKRLTQAGLLAITTLLTPLAAQAADVTLALSSWLPPRHPIVVNAIKPWAKDVEQVTEGRVSIRVLGKPLGSPPAHFDMARDGVADITYGLHSFTQDDRFKGSLLGQFSFIGDDAVTSSKAFWTVYTEDLNAREEHEGTHLLGLFTHGPGLLHNNKHRLETPADVEGLKIRVPSSYVGTLVDDLGGTSLFMSSTEVYEKLSRGVIDGVAFTYEALTAFNLADDVKYSMTVPGGVYNTTWFLVVNEDQWNSISPEDRAAIDAISGLAFAERVGQAWNDADAVAREELADSDIEFYPAPEPVLTALQASAQRQEETWAESLPEDEDGLAALTRLRAMTGVTVPQ
ncbi:TRAP transporter substrate-binding protein [Celeribacter ethanolicus]|uniref:TRAP transporter substrate-binding protein n=1 Tax=Celeribacter ethanolicus TaxID=1758178 RepID=UPI000829CA22|nr:TRAP transporter substrate-binding protein [Celeribacter ethanolicus]